MAFVLAQLGPWPMPDPIRDAWAAARPRLTPTDFRAGSPKQARESIGRAHAWLEKGMMTKAECDEIERRCVRRLQTYRGISE